MRAGDATPGAVPERAGGKYNLYSMDLGRAIGKLTDGPWDDFDPTLLPDSSLAFVIDARGGFALQPDVGADLVRRSAS